MAVNVGQRNVADTPQNKQLDACSKALDLALHTVQICNNRKVFLVEYQKEITDDIVKTAKDIYIHAMDGNYVYVSKDNDNWKRRVVCQTDAIACCNRLLALINLARRAFHLRGNKVTYWSKMVLETRALLSAWKESTVAQYKGM